MLKKQHLFNLAFAAIFLLQILISFNEDASNFGFIELKYIVKPLITILLMLYFYYETKLSSAFARKIFTGLFFGLIGDCALLFVNLNNSYFMIGLVAFLIGHLLYISAFYLDYKINPSLYKIANRVALIVFGVFCMAFYILLRPYLGALKIPVMMYAFIISLMAIMAVNRKGRVNDLSFKLILIGALLFLISDSALAYNKFVNQFKGAGVLIMATYMLAQYLITIGAVKRKPNLAVAIDAEDS